MVRFNRDAAGAAVPSAAFASPDTAAEHGSLQVAELVAVAIERLRRDLDAYHPHSPAIDSAMVRETHASILRQWHQHPPAAQTALLTALQEDAIGLLRQLQLRSARLVLADSYIHGLQDEAVMLEALTAIMLEEIYRIAADLRRLNAAHTLQ